MGEWTRIPGWEWIPSWNDDDDKPQTSITLLV